MPTLGFDISLYCDNLKATKPPYQCPIQECGKVYKSYSGIRFHLYKYDHDNPENNSGAPSPAPSDSGKKKPGGGRRSAARLAHHRSRRSPTPPDFRSSGPTRERTLTYAESQRLVEIDLDGRTHRLNIFEPLSVVTQDAVEGEVEKPVVVEEKAEKPVPLNKTGKEPKKKDVPAMPHPPHAVSKLPEASYKVLMDYVKCPPAPARPTNYYRFMEKSTDELDDEIEYDMDEEDYAWLELINDKRKKENLSSVTQEIFENLMDRFEKEAFFQSQTSGQDSHPSIDEDAVCSICMDGECQNSNVILFCDMCNLAVHQECYGVPYIPEGQWLCRRCLQSPSCAVDCSLCPNKGGAFKQTDDGRWAHVVCALWIPEVGFANTVFLEPIDSVDHIPPARWKLMCYICKQRGAGACIQCHKTNCYTAFHVTCAQQAGLFMKIEPIRETNVNGVYVSVRKTAFCDVHMPADQTHGHGPMINNGDENEDKSIAAKVAKAKSRQKMRKARKILAEKRNAMPVVSIPMIPPHRLSKIANRISLAKKQPFVLRLQSYWTLKRQSRNGVPLLRRLQSNHMSRNKEQTKNDKQSNELKAQLKYWQRLRQDLEKARLLVELIRKREKLKREQLRLHQLTVEMQLHPFVVFLRTVIDQLQDKDTTHIFSEPVSLKEVPDYLEYIKTPMDFLTMRNKIEGHYYNQMDDFESDFNLMIANCMTYNAKDTVFYRAAVKLRDLGGAIIRASRRMAEKIGYDPDTGLHLTEPPSVTPQLPEALDSIESFLPPEVRADMPLEEQLRVLLDKMDMANAIKQGGGRKTKLAKQIKKEIVKVRRQLALQRGHLGTDFDDRDSEEEMDTSSAEPLSPKSPPVKLGRVLKFPKPLKSPGPKSPGPKSPGPKSLGPRSPLPKTPTTPKAPTTPRQAAAPKLPSTPKLVDLKPPASPMKGTTTGKMKGKRGRPRVRSTKSESEQEIPTSTPVAKEQKSTEGGEEVAAHSETSEKPPADTSVTSASPSPSGVNRRTSVLFSKKALKTRKPQPLELQTTSQPQRKGPGRPPKVKQPKPQIFPDGDKEEPSEKAAHAKDGPKSPKSPGRQSRKRAASTSVTEMSSAPPPKRSMSTTERSEPASPAPHKRSMSISEPLSPRSPKSPKPPRSPSPKNIQQRDSFLQYRIDRSLSSSESDTSSETSNTDSTDSDSSSNASSDSGEGDDKTPRYSRRERKKKKKRRKSKVEGVVEHVEGQDEHADDGSGLLKPSSLRRTDRAVRTKTRFMSWDEEEDDSIPLEPLDLVWAKCRGYPWYPALIINPKMPKTGYFHNGVPIPVPPEDVLGLQRKFDELVYLVLFFDTKRTWQWLPRGKLDPLGVDSGLDKAKLAENKKPNIRKAVKLAYEKAIMHRCRVTGEPNPFVPSESESDTEMEFEIGGKNEKMD